MWTKHIFLIWSCIRTKGEVSRKENWFKTDRPPHLPTFPTVTTRWFSTDRSKAATLFKFF